jgi:hypothetical protein
MINNRGAIDSRKVLTGKDGALFNDRGTLLASVESYQTQVNVTNAKYQPLGDAQEHEVFQGYAVTLSFTQTVIEDDEFIVELIQAMKDRVMPSWNFQGVVKGRNNTEERMIYRQCVPSGTIDLQNLNVGDTIKRAWSLFVNEPPELQKLL